MFADSSAKRQNVAELFRSCKTFIIKLKVFASAMHNFQVKNHLRFVLSHDFFHPLEKRNSALNLTSTLTVLCRTQLAVHASNSKLCIKMFNNGKTALFPLMTRTQPEILLCKFNVSIAVDRHKKAAERARAKKKGR